MSIINNRSIALTLAGVAAATPLVVCGEEVKPNEVKPNIVWYLIEDTSMEYLALFNEGRGARMESVESLKESGVLFTRAYSNAPVSSAARTSLITSCFAPRMAGSFHRHIDDIETPDGYRMFPAYLRDAGYYTSNANKTDYNLRLKDGVWDDLKGGAAGWRKRTDASQPFFYMYTTMLTHESKLLFGRDKYESVKTSANPNSISIAPYHPDTELMRYSYATLYDQIAKADKDFAKMIAALEEDGLMDNTIIFFFGDNGGCLPGTKGYTNNIGLHVPLFVYVPERLQRYYSELQIGGVDEREVSFIDFGATALSIAGVEPPSNIDGTPFMGEFNKAKGERGDVVCYGDRFDDLYAFNRVLYRDGMRYSRNYQPYHTQGLNAYYRYKSLALQEWRELYHAGKLNDAQSKFFESFGCEELYDLERDPHELNNLALDPKYQDELISMRESLHTYLCDKRDLGFIPECVTIEQGRNDVAKFGEQHSRNIARYIDIADLQLATYKSAKSRLQDYLQSTDNIDKWWALTTLSSFASQSRGFTKSAEAIAQGKEYPSYLRSRAIVYLALVGERASVSSKNIEEILSTSQSLAEVLLVQNDLAYLKECGTLPQMQFSNDSLPFRSKSSDERVLFLNR